ncbi:hypothetical protein LSCM4_03417 [Leishmania orientalis]|uniref:Uncharacterized protein n=1 Tax=Leishmania orientalis TaxID=2249476 RepID=A0A836GY39_9TRYP|nr:hypothetical protein LSCM4_03417 [Leishmania orientalis]
MPQLRLPADYLYNPLYFVPKPNITREHRIGEGDAVASEHRISPAVLPSSTYLHRPLHFEPSSLNATPVRSHHSWSGSGENRLMRRSRDASPAAASAQGSRGLLPAADANKLLRGCGHVSPQEITVDATSADLDTSVPRSTRATQLRTEYVHHHIEERDEAAQNIFFLPKGRRLSAATLSSPRGHRGSPLTSASCSSILTSARQHRTGAASSQTPPYTKSARLRQRAAVQRREELERWELEKAAQVEWEQAATESASCNVLMPLKTANRGKSSSTAVATERSGGARDEAATTSPKGADLLHCTPRWQTSRTGSSADAMDDASQRVRTTPKKVSKRSTQRKDWRAAVSAYFDEREKAVEIQQHVAEATHPPSGDGALNLPAPLPSSKRCAQKQNGTAVKALCGEPTEAKLSDGMVVASTPAAWDKSERLPSRHHRRCCSHTAQRDAGNVSSVASREVCDSGHHALAMAAAASVPRERGTRIAPAAQMTEAKTNPNENVPPAQWAAPPKSSPLQDVDTTSSSSLSTIIFTVSSVPREDTAGVHYPEMRHSWQQVPAQLSRLHDGSDDADGNTSQLRSTGRGNREHSPSRLTLCVPAVAASCSGVCVTVSSLVASPIVSCLPSPRNVSASVVLDESRIAGAASAAPAKELVEISSFRRQPERLPPTAGVKESVALEQVPESELQDTLEAPSGLSAGALGRRATALPPVDAHAAPAHAPQPIPAEHACDVSVAVESPSQGSRGTGSSASRMSGEVGAQPPSGIEMTDWSAQVATTPLPQPEGRGAAEGGSERAPPAAEEEQLESSALSTRSSFLSVASYHAEEVAHASAEGRDAEDQPPHAAVLQAELLRHYRTTKPSSAAVESRPESCDDLNSSLRSHVRASSHGGGAIRVVDDRPAPLRQDWDARSSSLLPWNASTDNASALCGFVPAAAGVESDRGRSVAIDVSQMVTGDGLDMPHGWGLPLPPTNYTHVVAAWEARRRAAAAAGLANLSTTSEQPRQLLSKHISGSRARRREPAAADAMPPCQLPMEGPAGREAVDSLHLPNLQESGRCASAAPSAAMALSVAVAASAENGTRVGARPEVYVEKAAALSDAKSTDGAAGAAMLSDTVAAPRSGQKHSGQSPPVPAKDTHRSHADPSPASATVAAESQKPLLSLDDAKQLTAATSAAVKLSATSDGPCLRGSCPPAQRFAASREESPTEKAMGALAVSGDSVSPPNLAESIHLAQDTSHSSASGTADPRTLVGVSLPHPFSHTLAEGGAAIEESLQDAVVLRGSAEAAPALRFAKIREVESPVQKCAQLKEMCITCVSETVAQRPDVARGGSHPSSAGVGALDRYENLATVRLSASLPFATRLHTPDPAFVTASALLIEHGSFSLPTIETENSPLERSAHARHAASLSSGGGEGLGEGEPHSHAPTPLQYRLLQRKMRTTPPREEGEQEATAAQEEHECDAPLTQAFFRTDASTRCLPASAAESVAAGHADERAA